MMFLQHTLEQEHPQIVRIRPKKEGNFGVKKTGYVAAKCSKSCTKRPILFKLSNFIAYNNQLNTKSQKMLFA